MDKRNEAQKAQAARVAAAQDRINQQNREWRKLFTDGSH